MQYLSLRFVLAAVSKHQWRAVGEGKFPVRVFVAGINSVCRPDNIRGMVNMVPRARVVNFRKARHSIHNSRSEEFAEAIEDVYQQLETKPATVRLSRTGPTEPLNKRPPLVLVHGL